MTATRPLTAKISAASTDVIVIEMSMTLFTSRLEEGIEDGNYLALSDVKVGQSRNKKSLLTKKASRLKMSGESGWQRKNLANQFYED